VLTLQRLSSYAELVSALQAQVFQSDCLAAGMSERRVLQIS
jgi:hypothetical protein